MFEIVSRIQIVIGEQRLEEKIHLILVQTCTGVGSKLFVKNLSGNSLHETCLNTASQIKLESLGTGVLFLNSLRKRY